MRRLVLCAVVASAGAAAAAPLQIDGTVTGAASRWTADHSRIITESTIATPGGPVIVSQLGGTVAGVTMRTMPSPEILAPGEQVSIVAHYAADLAQRSHVVVDDLQILSAPYFVRTGPTKAGHYLYWESGCIFVTPDSAGTREIAGDGEFPIIDASIATWNTGVDTPSCSYIKVMNEGSAAVEVGNDNKNVIKFRDTSWCRPAIGDDPARCYPDTAAGITTATYVDDGTSSRDGAIVDADIEINGVDFAISVAGVTMGTQACHAELQNTLTHELGHLHGLEHTCSVPTDPARVDNNGNPVPQCSATTDPTIINAVMYPFQDCGETKKEMLTADDTNGICTIYPTAKDPGTCAPVGATSGCCSTGGGGTGALGSIGLALGVGAVLARRKVRGTPRSRYPF